MKRSIKLLLAGTVLFVASGNASAWWGNNNDWGGYGDDDWPVWTPMYWADEFFGDNSWGGGGPWNSGWNGMGSNYGYAPQHNYGYGYQMYPGYGSNAYSYPGYMYQAPATGYYNYGAAPVMPPQTQPARAPLPPVAPKPEVSVESQIPSAH